VESQPGVGSTFHFTIRAGRAETSLVPRGALATTLNPGFATNHPARILVVDDNLVNQRVAAQLLRKLGYSPDVASSGAEALTMLRLKPIDLVLMDVEMPEMDGPTAVAHIRREFPRASQPVVACLTAHAMSGDRERMLAAGMDEYITKPLRVDELQRVLSRLSELIRVRRV
jgi:CheY-like chemotaxis protein